ncbi:LOW QUALITY PROTEIN: conserved hypothetical protein, partial [Streptomyces sp. SPB78]
WRAGTASSSRACLGARLRSQRPPPHPARPPRAWTPRPCAAGFGGFHQGATQGRKDVEAALAEESGSLTLPGTEDEEPARGSASARPGSTRPPAAPTTADAREVSAEGDSAEEERR